MKLLLGWLFALIRYLTSVLQALSERRRKTEEERKVPIECNTYPSDLYVRPDVYIYSQSWLRSQGLSVTWDNPDIEIQYEGNVVPSHSLEADKEHEIVAKIHNRSISSPAIGVKVYFTYRNFGIGGGTNQIGEDKVDVSVLGGASNPAEAKCTWKTPSTPGHYCLLVSLLPPDDLNWLDNEGQENTNVVSVHPGDPEFIIPVINNTIFTKEISIDIDSYRLPEKTHQSGMRSFSGLIKPEKTASKIQDWLFGSDDPKYLENQITAARDWREANKQAVIDNNAVGKFPVPDEWNVKVDTTKIILKPDEEHNLTFSFKVPENIQEETEQVFNITGIDENKNVIGGVTYIAKVQI